MAQILKKIEKAGRSTDSIVGHLTNGEIVVPAQLAKIPEVKSAIQEIFDAYEVNLDEFTVGNKANKINPKTGYPEFFFSAIGRAISNIFRGGGGGGRSGSSSNNSQREAQERQQREAAARQAAEAARRRHEAEMKALREKAEAEEAARQKAIRDAAIESESSRARNIALGNATQIGEQLNARNYAPQPNQKLAQTSYTPSGVSVGNEKQAARAAMPVSGGNEYGASIAMAKKINEDNQGSNTPANRFQIPNLGGLQFGGA